MNVPGILVLRLGALANISIFVFTDLSLTRSNLGLDSICFPILKHSEISSWLISIPQPFFVTSKKSEVSSDFSLHPKIIKFFS